MEISDLGPWARLTFEGYKQHYCPAELAADLLADIEARGGRNMEIEGTAEGAIDLPGMILADRPWEDLMIGPFKLGIPSQDFEIFAAELERSPVRRFASGKEYHKIHGWMTCVVVTPEQRERMLRDMEAMLPEARRHQEEADERLTNALDRMRKAGVLAPAPTLVPAPPKDNN